MLKVSNLTKSYGPQLLLDRIAFHINPRERIGLVGRNGFGKTTLLRLLLKQEEPDEGEISIPKDYRLGHLEQHIHFTQPTVLAEACLGLPPGLEHEEWRVEKILSGLGFMEKDMERPPAEFSGGFQIRLQLAKVLVSDPDLLLLDEPTNYLDIISIRWLVKFLNAWKKELLVVTHDRNFMDSVTTHTMAIYRRKIRKLPGNTAKLYAQLMQEEEIHEKTRQNEEKRRQEIETFITRFRAKARLAGLVQSRIKTLQKTQVREKLEKIEDLDFEFTSESFPAKVMLEAQDLGFAYPGQDVPLITRLNLVVGQRERIAVIGKNGKGKTTLLRLLAGELQPSQGAIARHPKLQTAYFGQTNIQRLDPEKTIEEELMAADPTANRRKARDICGAMMFSGDAALKKISVLSGGERSRVLLGKLLLSPAHLLLLDEPTNHLDMESSEALLDALEVFPGAAIIVTHDEEFLYNLADKFIVFDRDRVFLYHGSYASFLREVGWQNEEAAGSEKPFILPLEPRAGGEITGSDETETSSASKKDTRKAKARILHEKSKVLKPLESRRDDLERSIATLEKDLAGNEQLMIDASMAGDAAAIAELPKKRRDLQEQVDFLYQKLEEVTKEYEKKAAEFEKKIAKETS